MTKGRIWLIGVLLVTGGLGWWLWQTEWVEIHQGATPTVAAKRNPYLAADRFLQAQGMAVQSEIGLHSLRRPGQLQNIETLLLIDAYGALSEALAGQVLAWVWDGGQLVMAGQNPYRIPESLREDFLFDHFGVEVKRPSGRPREAFEFTVLDDILGTASPCGIDIDPAEVRFAPGGEQVQVGFPSQNRLSLERAHSDLVVKDHRGPRLAQFEYGAGRVTLLADTRLWTNNYIGCRDNAYLLWKLVGDGQSVLVLRNQEATSLSQILWQRAGWCLSLGLALLVLFLWRQGLRFGPVAVEVGRQRHRFMEHIQASARFLWRHGQAATLVETLRADIEAKVAQRLPGYAAWPEARQHEELARLTGLSQTQVAQAMAAAPQDELRFTHCVQDLQTIRNNL